MDRAEKSFEVSEIISRYLAEGLNEAEGLLLEQWLEESEAHRKLFQRLKEERLLKEKVAAYERINLHKALFELLEEKHKLEKAGRRRMIRRSLRIAAALLIPVLFAVWWLATPPMRSSGQEETPDMSKKVMLTLASGEALELGPQLIERLGMEDRIIIKGDSGLMAFKAGEKPLPEAFRQTTVSVPRGGEFSLILSDGTRVWLNAETSLTFPLAFSGEQRTVFLDGEAYFEVTHDPQKAFIVESSAANVRVYGTSFNMKAYAEEAETVATLVSGEIGFEVNSRDEEIRMKPGEQVVLTGGEWSRKNVDVSLYTSWKEGRMVFSSIRLEDMLNTLSRWYDVEVVFARDEIRDLLYSGEVRKYEDFRDVLEIIESTQSVRFKVEGRVIIVY